MKELGIDIQFQSPKGRLQTQKFKDVMDIEILFQSPKGRLQTDYDYDLYGGWY